MIRRGGRSAIRRPPHPAPPAGSDLVPSLPPAVVGSSDGSDAPMAVRESAASLGAAAPLPLRVANPSSRPRLLRAHLPHRLLLDPLCLSVLLARSPSGVPVRVSGPVHGLYVGFARTPDAPTGVHGPAPSGACNSVGSDAGSPGAVGSAAATIRSVPREETGRARQESSPARPSALLPYTLLRKPRGWSATG